jgi:hypothetical protein
MATNASVKIIKSSPYKGGNRTWSNRYHFNGGTPADSAHWNTLFDAIVLKEKTTLQALTSIVEAIGYAAGSDVPVASKTYTTPGTLTPVAGNFLSPLNTAALIRYSTNTRTTKNHPIYCFNYVHGAFVLNGSPGNMTLDLNQKTALASYATNWISGFTDGSITAVRATPRGSLATGSIVEEYVTHRDFPYVSSV